MVRKGTGSLIGAIGGLVFVLANAGQLPPGLAAPARVLGAVAFLAVVWWAVIRPRHQPSPRVGPRPGARRTYLISVAAMVVALPLGSLLLNRVLHRSELTLAWVVLVVGLHFWPFARAFGLEVFSWLSATLVGVALIGGVAVLLTGSVASGWTGVAAGAALLGFSATGGRRSTPVDPG